MKTELPNAERVHHPYSPSKLQPLEACPNYESRFTESEAARIGTLQHDVADTGVDDKRLADYRALAVVECMKFVDERFRLYPKGQRLHEIYLPIDDEKICAHVGTEMFTPDPADPEDVVERDVFQVFDGTTAGYVDVALLSEDQTTAEVIDFKFGQVAVEAAHNNLQGIAYMLGLKKRFPKIKKCFIWFVMPHRDQITGTVFEDLDVEGPMLHLRIRTVVQRAVEARKVKVPFSMATPALGSCLFCANIGKCPKVAELALKVGQKYKPILFPASMDTTVFSDPAQVELGLKLSQIIKVWADAYRAQATAKTIDDPKFAPKNYILVQSQKRSVVKAKALGELAKQYLPEEMRGRVEELYDVALGSLEELISTAAPRGQKEKTVEEFGKKAEEAKLVELGTPFAFLRQDNKAKE